MKHIFYTCLLFFSAYNASAQCDLHAKTDEFTGKTTVFTDKVRIIKSGDSHLLKSINQFHDKRCFYKDHMQFLLQDGNAYLAFAEFSDICLCTISAVSFKFKDGSVLTKSNVRVGQAVNIGSGQEQDVFFEITKDDLARFAASEVFKVRLNEYNCEDHPVAEDELDDKPAAAIKEGAACLLQKLP